jgi:UDP-glucose 4-epimerase
LVVHAAAAMPGQPCGREDLARYRRVNVEGTLALARAAASAGARRFVFVSSTAAMGRPDGTGTVDEATPCRPSSPYELTKHQAELGLLELAAQTGLSVVILRPCLIAGAGQRGGVLLKLFAWCRRGLFPVFGGRLDLAKPLVAVEDVVQALLLAATREGAGGPYLVTSGERHTLGEFLEVAGRLVGNPLPYRTVPLPLARLAAAVTTPLARAAGLPPLLSPERLDLFLADRGAIDVARARSGLGYAPRRTALEPMLAETHAWYVASGQLPA